MYKKLIDQLRGLAQDERDLAKALGFYTDTPFAQSMSQAADAIEKLQAERDAAVADLTAAGLCNPCGHWNGSKCTKRGKCEFVWRGLEANNEQQD